MKNRGVLSGGPRLPGTSHKAEGRPGDLPGQIAAKEPSPGVVDLPKGKAGPDRAAGPRDLPTPSDPVPAFPPVPSATRKFSLSLRIESRLAGEFAGLMAGYPAAGQPAIRRELARRLRARLAEPAPPGLQSGKVPTTTIRLDLRLSPHIVGLLRQRQDPLGLMPLTTVLTWAVEPHYAALLQDILDSADRGTNA